MCAPPHLARLSSALPPLPVTPCFLLARPVWPRAETIRPCQLAHRVEIRTSSSRMLTLMTAATSHTMKCAYHIYYSLLSFWSSPSRPRIERTTAVTTYAFLTRPNDRTLIQNIPLVHAARCGGGGASACRFHLLGVPQDEPVAVQRQKPVRILSVSIAETERRNRHVFSELCLK
eukprot:COSAG06_NODE_6302_length_2991_cov_4.691586_2_plen_174_part_00